MAHWTPDDIPWDQFDPARVDADVLKLVKAAAMVEKNAADYAAYLGNVFPDDEVFRKAARRWAEEEVQHGDVLGRWAEMADPEFDFAQRFETFKKGFRIPIESTSSVRGSRAGELVARCIVEVGTSSYYSALRDAVDEPVLKAICDRIAGDEFRHYKLFHSHLRRYQRDEHASRWSRVKVVLQRTLEAEDDELSYAYYAANNTGEPYRREPNAAAYLGRASAVYRPDIVRRGVAMAMAAAGLKEDGWLSRVLSAFAWRGVQRRRRRFLRLAAS
ncbi:MAG: ferritin-like domain-containing protein [Alphaproteobacteria bacterium]|nr:ferritin-like domain-containing protein [Alphaproteobacteria bacterium]